MQKKEIRDFNTHWAFAFEIETSVLLCDLQWWWWWHDEEAGDVDDVDVILLMMMLTMLMMMTRWQKFAGFSFLPKGRDHLFTRVQFFSSFLSPPCGALTIFKWFSLSFQCILLSVNKNPVGPSQGRRMCIKTFTNLILEIYLWNWKFSHSISLAN